MEVYDYCFSKNITSYCFCRELSDHNFDQLLLFYSFKQTAGLIVITNKNICKIVLFIKKHFDRCDCF